MAKPIPVFSFVFAAYAATCAMPESSWRASSIQKLPTFDPFLDAWRTRAARKGGLFAKVGLLTGAAKGDLRFARRSTTDLFEDLWLEAIAESRLGFIGVAMHGPGLPTTIEPGQRVRFERIDVLDWRLGELRTMSPAPLHGCTKRHPRDMLAELSESVVT